MDGNLRYLVLLLSLLNLNFSLAEAQKQIACKPSGHSLSDAPRTWIGSANPCQPSTLSFPVIDSGFTSITSISLRLDYNPNGMVYDTFSNLNSQLTGIIINDIHVSDSLNKIMFVWSDINPKTVPDGQPLLSLVFHYTGGATSLTWNNASNNGSDCEYGDANGDPLNDLPSISFYHNGYVQGGAVGAAGNITGSNEVTRGDANVRYTVPPIQNATTYIWTIPPGSEITAGAGTNEVYLHFTSTATSGYLQVHGVAGNCTGALSPPFFVNVLTTGIPVEDTYSLAVSPNPGSSMLRVSYYLPEDARVDLELFNTLGQPVTHSSCSYESGNHQQLLDTSGLDAGIYDLKVQFSFNGKNVVTLKKVVIIK